MHSKTKAIFSGIAISAVLLALASEPAAARMGRGGFGGGGGLAAAGLGVVVSREAASAVAASGVVASLQPDGRALA